MWNEGKNLSTGYVQYVPIYTALKHIKIRLFMDINIHCKGNIICMKIIYQIHIWVILRREGRDLTKMEGFFYIKDLNCGKLLSCSPNTFLLSYKSNCYISEWQCTYPGLLH